jgi:hypothetical protein
MIGQAFAVPSTQVQTPITVVDSTTLDLTSSGVDNHTLTGVVKISSTAGNDITSDATGIYSKSDFTIAGNLGGTDLINNHETLNIVGGTNSGIISTITGNTATLTLNTPLKTVANECGPTTTNATATHSLGEVLIDAAGKLWTAIPTANTAVSGMQGFPDVTVNSPTVSTVAAPSTSDSITITNPSPCRAMTVLATYNWNSNNALTLNGTKNTVNTLYVNGVLQAPASAGGFNTTFNTNLATTGLAQADLAPGVRMVSVTIPAGGNVVLRSTLHITSNNGANFIALESRHWGYIGVTV